MTKYFLLCTHSLLTIPTYGLPDCIIIATCSSRNSSSPVNRTVRALRKCSLLPPSGMWCCQCQWVIQFRLFEAKYNYEYFHSLNVHVWPCGTYLSLQMRALHCFKTSEFDYRFTRSHIPLRKPLNLLLDLHLLVLLLLKEASEHAIYGSAWRWYEDLSVSTKRQYTA